MAKKFTARLLVRGKGVSPDLKVTAINLHPGQEYDLKNVDDVLLASGFTSLSPGAGFPLSPSLQINSDLQTCDEPQLQRLAKAELNRHNSLSYRSYSVEPEKHLCVIGNKPQEIEEFLDTYGGLLELTPLMLKGFHPDIPTAAELEVIQDKNGFQLSYSVRSPVNLNSCTYCGACGAACKEDCLDANLFLDFSRCTYCRECEAACEAGAIDLYTVEEASVHVPAILLLDGAEEELPKFTKGVYREDTFKEYCATQFAYQIDEAVSHDPLLCQFDGNRQTGCRLCEETCRFGAIAMEDSGVVVDNLKCEECGACVGCCPTGALQYERFSDASFIDYISTLNISPGTTLVLGNEEQLQQLWWQKKDVVEEPVLYLEYPQVEALSVFHLLYLYGAGATRIILLSEETGIEDVKRPFEYLVDFASLLLSIYLDVKNSITLCSLKQFQQLPKFQSGLQLNNVFTGGQDQGGRRKNLAALLQFFAMQTEVAAEIAPNSLVPFATIHCDPDKCTNCMACLNACKVGALRASEDGLTLICTTSLCVGCGNCQRICPEEALRMQGGAVLDHDFFEKKIIADADPMACKRCGKVFGSKKSYERVMAILAKKESVDTSHFEYCDTCRVLNLMENA